jgi:hypothetical protein
MCPFPLTQKLLEQIHLIPIRSKLLQPKSCELKAKVHDLACPSSATAPQNRENSSMRAIAFHLRAIPSLNRAIPTLSPLNKSSDWNV